MSWNSGNCATAPQGLPAPNCSVQMTRERGSVKGPLRELSLRDGPSEVERETLS